MLDKLTTEARNKRTMNLDLMSIHDILLEMNKEDCKVPIIVSEVLTLVEKIVQCTVHSLNRGGRLIYFGAGTSGRLGILDAVECLPTFSASSDQVVGLIAGGREAVMRAVEGAEDSQEMGKQDLRDIHLSDKDTVVGIAASGRTPYVIGGLKYAKQVGAIAASLSCNVDALISRYADIAIEVETGPEVLTGSTRLKAGTAQKLILNMISTASMIRIGKVYENLMVDVQSTNEKLIARSKKIISEATGIDEYLAAQIYKQANYNVKTAIVMILLNCSLDEAEKLMVSANGFIRKAVMTKRKANNS